MKIGIDIRSLLEGYRTGIGEYTYNLINEFLKKDTQNQYHLFYNQRHSIKKEPPRFEGENVKCFDYKYPNQWFNLSLRYLGWPRVEKLCGNPDVVWFPNFGFMNFNMRAPYVLTVHDLSFERYPEFFTPVHRLWHKMINCKKMALGAARIIAVSENTKRDLVDLYGVESQKVEVIYEGVCHTNYANEDANYANMRMVREKYNLPEKFVLFLGTIEPRKNIEVIIRAFDKLITNHSSLITKDGYQLILAGGKGWNNEQIYKIYDQVKHKDKIRFLGYVEQDEKSALYNLASLFVFPSIYEGFGLPPLEAMACGTPVIISNTSSLPEVVGDAGLMVNPYNINELYEAMRVMLTDDVLRERFIEKGLERVKRFSWEKCAERTLGVIENTGGVE